MTLHWRHISTLEAMYFNCICRTPTCLLFKELTKKKSGLNKSIQQGPMLNKQHLFWTIWNNTVTVLESKRMKLLRWNNLKNELIWLHHSLNPFTVVEMLKQVKSKAMIKTVSAGSWMGCYIFIFISYCHFQLLPTFLSSLQYLCIFYLQCVKLSLCGFFTRTFNFPRCCLVH